MEYKGIKISKINFVKHDKYVALVGLHCVYGGSIEIIKRKIDKAIIKLESKKYEKEIVEKNVVKVKIDCLDDIAF